MIKLTNVEKAFQDTEVLKGVSLTIDDGQIFGIIGQSGAGKSTLLRCINGLEPFDGGTIEVDGVSVGSLTKDEMRRLQRQMGMIFQDFNLLERLDVFDNIALPMRFWGINPKKQENTDKIMGLIHLVGLDEKVHAKPRELSGGQKQRVAIARAIVLDPKFLLCDEATSALDPEITKDILSLLGRINREMGITIVVVTHQMEVIRQVCEHVVFLGEGRVLAEGKPEELFVRPPTDEIAGFVRERSSNLPDHGINVRLFFMGGAEPIVTRMARELDCDFGICWAKLEDFRDKTCGSIVINFEEGDFAAAERFLNDNDIHWEVVR